MLSSASALQAVLSVATYPVSTRYLSAADFGVYALIMSIVAFLAVVTELGSGYLLPAHYPSLPDRERRTLLATLLFITIAASIILTAIFAVPGSLYLASHYPDIGIAVYVIPFAIFLTAIDVFSATIFTVTGSTNFLAFKVFSRAIGQFCATLMFLVVFNLGLSSLFLGAVAGQLVSLPAFALGYARIGGRHPSFAWVKALARETPAALASGIAGSIRPLVENAFITALLGAGPLGYLGHARLYRNIAVIWTKAISNSGWKVSLDEARTDPRNMTNTRELWQFIGLVSGLSAIGFIAVSRELIAFITNDVLTPSAPLACLLYCSIVTGCLGRMDLAIIYETGKARRLVMQSLIVSVIALGVTGLAIWMTDSLLVVGWMVLIESIVLLFVMRRLSGLNDNSVATDSAILLTLAAGFAVWWLKYVGNADFLTVAVTAVISILVLMIAYHMRIVGAAMRIRRMLWS